MNVLSPITMKVTIDVPPSLDRHELTLPSNYDLWVTHTPICIVCGKQSCAAYGGGKEGIDLSDGRVLIADICPNCNQDTPHVVDRL